MSVFSELLSHLLEVLACVSSLTKFFKLDDELSEVELGVSFNHLIKLFLWTIIKSSKFLLSHRVSFSLELLWSNVAFRSIEFKQLKGLEFGVF